MLKTELHFLKKRKGTILEPQPEPEPDPEPEPES
jgi:hypothetical protein